MKISLLLKKRVTVMDETVFFLTALMAEIRYSKSDILKIMSVFSNESSVDNLTFLDAFGGNSDYCDFHTVWRNAVSSFSYYKSEEKEKMLQLGSFLGTTDIISQIDTIKLYTSFFEVYRTKALNDYEKHGKASSLFGFFIGVSAFILFL